MGLNIQSSSSQPFDSIESSESEDRGNARSFQGNEQPEAFNSRNSYGSSGGLDDTLGGLAGAFDGDGIGSATRSYGGFGNEGGSSQNSSFLQTLKQALGLGSRDQNLGQQSGFTDDSSSRNGNGIAGGSRGGGSAGAPAISGGNGGAIPPAAATQQSPVGNVNSSTGAAASSGPNTLGPNIPSALKPWTADIEAASKQTGVPANLIGAVVLQESGGKGNVNSTTNPALGLPDSGLMQVDSATFQGLQQQNPGLLGGKSVSDPATNIMAGALLLKQLGANTNDPNKLSSALTAYNGNATSGYASQVSDKLKALNDGTLPVPGGFS